VDIYDLSQAVEDGATVRVYYEARLVKVELPKKARAILDEGIRRRHRVVTIVRQNATVDWDKKEQVRAALRRHICRLLRSTSTRPTSGKQQFCS
jgi:type I site-specific restriction-modification system R (restriction) subunit